MSTAGALPLTVEQLNAVSPYKLRRWWYTFQTDLPDAVDAEALDRALSLVVGRHEPLRLRLRPRDGGYEQVFLPPPRGVLHIEQVPGELSFHRTHLDVIESGPFRATLARYPDGPQRLFVSVHHLAWDAWSYYLWRSELSTAYAAFSRGVQPELPPLRGSFRAFAQEQATAGSELTPAQQQHWAAAFAGDWPFCGTPGPASPAGDAATGGEVAGPEKTGPEKTGPEQTGPEQTGPEQTGPEKRWGRMRSEPFADAVPRRLAAVARACRVTVPTVLLGLVALGLGEVYEVRDVLVHVAHHGRDRRQLQDLIGMFNRSVPVRVRFTREEALSVYLARVSATVRDATRFSEAPFTSARLLEHLGRSPEVTGRLTHLAVSLQFSRRPVSAPVGAATAGAGPATGQEPSESSGDDLRPLTTRTWTPRPHQLWVSAEAEPELKFVVEHDRRMFGDDIVARVLEALGGLSDALAVQAVMQPLGKLLDAR